MESLLCHEPQAVHASEAFLYFPNSHTPEPCRQSRRFTPDDGAMINRAQTLSVRSYFGQRRQKPFTMVIPISSYSLPALQTLRRQSDPLKHWINPPKADISQFGYSRILIPLFYCQPLFSSFSYACFTAAHATLWAASSWVSFPRRAFGSLYCSQALLNAFK